MFSALNRMERCLTIRTNNRTIVKNFHCAKGYVFSWIRIFIVLRNTIYIYTIYIYIYFHTLTKNLVLYFFKNVFCINIWNLYFNDWRAVALYILKKGDCIFVIITSDYANGCYFYISIRA